MIIELSNFISLQLLSKKRNPFRRSPCSGDCRVLRRLPRPPCSRAVVGAPCSRVSPFLLVYLCGLGEGQLDKVLLPVQIRCSQRRSRGVRCCGRRQRTALSHRAALFLLLGASVRLGFFLRSRLALSGLVAHGSSVALSKCSLISQGGM